MASFVAFKFMLVRIGCNALMSGDSIINGFDEIGILGEVKDKDMDKLVCHIVSWQGQRVAPHDAAGTLITSVPQQIILPFFSIKKLRLCGTGSYRKCGTIYPSLLRSVQTHRYVP